MTRQPYSANPGDEPVPFKNGRLPEDSNFFIVSNRFWPRENLLHVDACSSIWRLKSRDASQLPFNYYPWHKA